VGKVQGGRLAGFHAPKNPVQELRDKSMQKDKWNMFVGDRRYKTNSLLQFLDRFTKNIYEKQLLPTASYSVRLLLVAMALADIWFYGYESCAVDGCFLQRLVCLLMAACSIYGTHRSQRLKSMSHGLKVAIIVRFSFF